MRALRHGECDRGRSSSLLAFEDQENPKITAARFRRRETSKEEKGHGVQRKNTAGIIRVVARKRALGGGSWRGRGVLVLGCFLSRATRDQSHKKTKLWGLIYLAL